MTNGFRSQECVPLVLAR